MAITRLICTNLIDDDLGGSSTSSVASIVNDAGRVMLGLHMWRWTLANSTLNTTASQEYITLPSDYGGLDRISPNTPTGSIEMITMEALEMLRGDFSTTTSVDHYYGSIVSVIGAGTEAYRLELYPAPADSTTGAFRIAYRKAWVVLAESGADGDALTMPTYMEPLFKAILLEMARARDERDVAGEADRIERIAESKLFQTALRADAKALQSGLRLGGSSGYPNPYGGPNRDRVSLA